MEYSGGPASIYFFMSIYICYTYNSSSIVFYLYLHPFPSTYISAYLHFQFSNYFCPSSCQFFLNSIPRISFTPISLIKPISNISFCFVIHFSKCFGTFSIFPYCTVHSHLPPLVLLFYFLLFPSFIFFVFLKHYSLL